MSLNAHFTVSGENPANFILENDIRHFPKVDKLVRLKNAQVDKARIPARHVVADLAVNPSLGELLGGNEFEVILVDPPWYEYFARAGGFEVRREVDQHIGSASIPTNPHPYWSMEEILALPIASISAPQSFCFLWCGNRHVEQATACLLHWGFRRIEDVCWIKTNKENRNFDYLPYGAGNLFKTTKEHLLVGIKGTVQRSTDNHLMHANIDSDVVVAEEPEEFGSKKKPEEIYRLIERFCNSQRRLELFATSLRNGWVSVGRDLPGPSTYEPGEFAELTRNPYLPFDRDIELLRPKSPKSRRTP